MYEILLLGLLLVVAYFIAHHAVMFLDRRSGGTLGVWRTAWFFLIFLVLVMGSQWLARSLLGAPGA